MNCRVSDCGSVGNGLVCETALVRGSVALTERPFCFVLSGKRALTCCDYCFMPATLRCTKCRAVRYCSVSCQRSAWKWALHRGECDFLASAAKERAVVDNVRLCLRMAWRMREREGDDVLCVLDRETLRRMEELATQCRDSQHYVELGTVLAARSLVWMEPAAVTKLLIVLQTNAMRIPDGNTGAPLAVGLYAFGSAANHACAPSAIALFSKCALELVVCRQLAAGEPITVGYIDVRIPRPIRRFLLYDSWNFDCACQTCSAGEVGELICADCGKLLTCDNELLWTLFECLGDSEWYCGEEPKKRFFRYCGGGVEDSGGHHVCPRASASAKEAISLASKASQLAAISHKPKHRFAELVWTLIFVGEKKLLVPHGYFWRCAALRYALHCVNVANEVGVEEDMVPLFDSAARVNEFLWRAFEESWDDGPLALGCLISQIRCDAWLASYKMEKDLRGSQGMQSAEHTNKVRIALDKAQKLAVKIYSNCKCKHTICEDLLQTIGEITGGGGGAVKH